MDSTSTASSTAATDTIEDSKWGSIELLAHDPKDSIVAVLTNPNTTVSTKADNSLNFLSTSTSVQVYEADTLLTAVNTTPSTNGTYQVTQSLGAGISQYTSPSVSSGVYTSNAISGMTTGSGTRTYSISGLRQNGESFTRTIIQTLNKTAGTESIHIYIDQDEGSVVRFPSTGNRPSTDSRTVKADVQGVDSGTGTYQVQWRNGGSVIATTNVSFPSGIATRTINLPADENDYPYQLETRLLRSGSQIASDTHTFYAVRNGQKGDSTTTGILTNETHSLRKDSDLVVDFDGSGTDIEMFEGGLALSLIHI